MAYSGAVASVLHSAVALAGAVYALQSGSLSSSAVLLELAMFLAAVLVGALCGLLCSVWAPMRWYSFGLAAAVGLYAPPSVAAALALKARHLSQASPPMHLAPAFPYAAIASSHEAAKTSDPAAAASSKSLVALIFGWSVLLLLLTLAGVMSGYIAGLLVVFAVLGDAVHRQLRTRIGRTPALYAYLLCLAPAMMHWFELFHGQ